jgi:hypothetical protein
MATKKQRRRRSKERRHEWEYVYVDEEGREIEVETDEDEPERARNDRRAPAARKSANKPERTRGRRGQRAVEPPSWRRSSRRGALFAPLMLLVVYLLQPKGSKNMAGALVQTAILLAFFVPFTYLMDALMYRAFRKRLERGGGASTRR